MLEKKFPLHDELVLCTVSRILGTTVFVNLDDYNKEGVIATSEIAPGRIRNIRDYVMPNKKIVCKVLRVDEKTGHIDLSLRRVRVKERSDILERYKREKNALAILKVVSKEKTDDIIKKIKDKGLTIYEFTQKIDDVEPESFGLTKQQYEQLRKILKEKPQKKILVREKFEIKCEVSDGIKRIKSILTKVLKGESDVNITYISAPSYLISVESVDYKEANKKLEELKKNIIESAKLNECKVEFRE
jgi:translation initiation factor 2 subunit 1